MLQSRGSVPSSACVLVRDDLFCHRACDAHAWVVVISDAAPDGAIKRPLPTTQLIFLMVTTAMLGCEWHLAGFLRFAILILVAQILVQRYTGRS
jgi:hypothetical protein